MQSSGILKRLEEKWIPAEVDDGQINAQGPQVTLDHVRGIITLYLTILLMSVGIFFIEVLAQKFNSSEFRYKIKL